MKKEVFQILPLYHFFERLRKNQFPLGIDDYEDFIKAARFEIGITATNYGPYLQVLKSDGSLDKNNHQYPKQQLLRLCRILWLKPGQSTRLFEDLFEETFFLDFQPLEEPSEITETKIPDAPVDITPKAGLPSNDRNDDGHEEVPEVPPVSGDMDGSPEEVADKEVCVRIGMSERQKSGYLELLNPSVETERSKFLFSNRYYPIDRRKIQQNLRALPVEGYLYNTRAVDIDATIQKAVDTGFFRDHATKKQKIPVTRMLFLVDHQGSMVAFQQLAGNLKEALEQAFKSNKKLPAGFIKTFYFFNGIGEHLFLNTTHTRYQSLTKVLEPMKAKTSHIIILSDAGAARGNFNSHRIEETKKMLQRLRYYTHRIAWLNPMPKDRWTNSSAEEIAKNINMFEANETGIKNAVEILKGSTSKIIQMA